MPTCVECLQSNKKKYYVIPGTNTFICLECFTKEPIVVEGKSQKQRFIRWKCVIHNCGSYNFNMIGRHEMPWCEIIKEETIGIRKPKTYGGFNGNVGRHYFKDWIQHVQAHDKQLHDIQKYKKYQEKHQIIKLRRPHHAYNTKRVRRT